MTSDSHSVTWFLLAFVVREKRKHDFAAGDGEVVYRYCMVFGSCGLDCVQKCQWDVGLTYVNGHKRVGNALWCPTLGGTPTPEMRAGWKRSMQLGE